MTGLVSVAVPGLDHGASPFPIAIRRGPFVFSSAIPGRDPATGILPTSVEEQAATALANVERVVAAAGGSAADIVKVVIFARDRAAVRAALDQPWVALFPDPSSRPVRHTLQADIPGGMHMQVEFYAILEDDAP
jgi:2-iminobutanoate/2-iminopropanoate deaminase